MPALSKDTSPHSTQKTENLVKIRIWKKKKRHFPSLFPTNRSKTGQEAIKNIFSLEFLV